MKRMPLFSVIIQPRQKRLKGLVCGIAGKQIRNAFSLKVARFTDPEMTVEGFSVIFPQNTQNFIGREQIIFSLLALAVGILCAIEAALGRGHFTQDIAGSFLCDVKIHRLFCDSIRFAVGEDQERVVIQHFFKMRN